MFNILAVALLLLTVGMVVVPDARGRRTILMEVRVVRALQNLALAQARFQQSTAKDLDGDGVGEYGFLPELNRPGPDGTPFLPPAIRNIDAGGLADCYGYRIAVLLPDATGRPIAAADRPSVDPALASRSFLALAWPREADRAGLRAYAIHADFLVVEHPNLDRTVTGSALPVIRLPRLAHRDSTTGRTLPPSPWPQPWNPFLSVVQTNWMRTRFQELGLTHTFPQ